MNTIPSLRAARVAALFENYGPEREHVVCDFLADLGHYCDVHGILLHEELRRACKHYLEETTTKTPRSYLI